MKTSDALKEAKIEKLRLPDLLQYFSVLEVHRKQLVCCDCETVYLYEERLVKSGTSQHRFWFLKRQFPIGQEERPVIDAIADLVRRYKSKAATDKWLGV